MGYDMQFIQDEVMKHMNKEYLKVWGFHFESEDTTEEGTTEGDGTTEGGDTTADGSTDDGSTTDGGAWVYNNEFEENKII